MIRSILNGGLIGSVLIVAACGSAGTPSAVPTPVAPPTPTPAPASTPQAASCFLSSMPDLHNTCPKLAARLQDHVSSAVDDVIKKHPELFDFTDDRGGSIKVLDRQKYQTAVVAAINAQGGICAKDDNEEVAVKVTNDYHEQYNIWTSAGYTRRSYITTCLPAQF